jgi:hypothetical protein
MRWFAAAVGGLAAVAAALAPVADAALLRVDGGVYALARAGPVVYAGGDFTVAGTPAHGGLAEVNAAGQTVWRSKSDATRDVSAVADDGAGGWFTAADDSTVTHVGSNGAVVSTFDITPPLTIEGLARAGATLVVVASDFTGPQIFGYSTGLHPTRVWKLAVAGDQNGLALAATPTAVFIAGRFLGVAGTARSGIAELNPADGSVVPGFDPRIDAQVDAMAVDPSGDEVYIAGAFTSVNGVPRHGLAALAIADGSVDSSFVLSGAADGGFTDLAVDDTSVYAIGEFTKIGGKARHWFAAFSRADGAVEPLNPKLTPASPGAGGGVPGHINAMASDGGVLYIGGWFGSVDGVPRLNAAAIRLSDGSPTQWNPGPGGEIDSLGFAVVGVRVVGGAVLLYGSFSMLSAVPVPGLAAFDAATGTLLPSQFSVDGYVAAIVRHGATLYIAGAFDRVNGRRRTNLAAIDLRTGRVTRWRPSVSWAPGDFIVSMAVWRGRVYVGGDKGLIAISRRSGRPLRVAFPIDASVTALTVAGRTLYVGTGTIGGPAGAGTVTALDARDGRELSFRAMVVGLPWQILPVAARVYVLGELRQVNGRPRRGIAALRRSDGQLLPPTVRIGRRGSVLAATLLGGDLYLTGRFDELNGQPRAGIGAVRPGSGRPIGWTTAIPERGYTLLGADGHLYGGGLSWVGLLK